MMKYLFIFCFFAANLYAQSTRSLINEGVELYNNKEYTESEVNFLKGLENAPESFEARFNLGDAYYKQEKYDEALRSFNSALSQTDDKDLKAKVHHNIGNSLLKSNKIKESIEAYKNALKLNPDDEDTKYNLSYALSLLNQDQNKQQNKDQNKQDNKDQDQQDQDQQNQEKNKQDQQNQDQQNKDQEQNEQKQNKSGDNQEAQQDNLKQPEKNEISKEEAQRILEALRNNEKDLQKKLRKHSGTPVKTEKDW